MTVLNARPYQGLLKRFWLEVSLAGALGSILFILGSTWLFTTCFENKIPAIPVALGLIGIGYAIFGLVSVKNYKQGWQEKQPVVNFDNNGIEFLGLSKISWDNISFSVSVGEYSKHGLDLGFSVAFLQKGKQLQLHSAIKQIIKPDNKMRLTSTYLGLAIKGTPANFGEGWKLGKITRLKNVKGEEIAYLLVTPDLFLGEDEYNLLIKEIQTQLKERFNLALNVHYGNAFAAITSTWFANFYQEVVCDGSGLSPKGKDFVSWFATLNSEKLNDINHIIYEAERKNPQIVQERINVVNELSEKIMRETGNTLFVDAFYCNAIAFKVADQALSLSKNNSPLASSAAAFEAYGLILVANQFNVEVTENQRYVLCNPLEEAGYKQTPTRTFNEDNTNKTFPHGGGFPQLPPLPPLPNMKS